MDHPCIEDRTFEANRVLAQEDDAGPCVRCGRPTHGFRGFVRLTASASTYPAFVQMTQQPEGVYSKSKITCLDCFQGLLRFLEDKPDQEPRRLAPDEIEKLTPEEIRINIT